VNKDWDIVFQLTFLENGFWWNYSRERFQIAGGKNQDNFIIGMTDIGGVSDILASLRGTHNLLTDLMMEPDKVHIMQKKILEDWFRVYFELDRIIRNHQEGKSAWMGIWCPEDWYPLQCDFSAMISPVMFREFVLPHLKQQTEKLPYSIYHLDGPGQIPHLDLLLTLDRLTGIQWVPGSGAPDYDSETWDPLYRKILDSGKRLVLSGVPFHKIETILKRIGTRNILITSYCAYKQDADRLIKKYKRARCFNTETQEKNREQYKIIAGACLNSIIQKDNN
jgi:5-methyltetrahydrofolate--homocysteine methyltransferase